MFCSTSLTSISSVCSPPIHQNPMQRYQYAEISICKDINMQIYALCLQRCNAMDFDWTHMMRSWDKSLMPCYLTVLSLRRKVWTWHRWIIFQSSQSCTWQDLVLIHAGDAFNPWWPFRSMLTLDHWTMGAMDHSKTTSSYHSLCLCSLLSGAASWTLTSLPRFLWELPPCLGGELYG